LTILDFKKYHPQDLEANVVSWVKRNSAEHIIAEMY